MQYAEQFINWLQTLPPLGVLLLMFSVAYIENIFPPAPSDVILIFSGTLIGMGTVGFAPSLIAATLGSTLGFVTAYLLGRYFERHVVEGRFSRFLPVGTIQQVEQLFQKYGYGVIIANRFLAGTRAVVSFFAGMSKMNLPLTTLLSALSAAVWNSILLYLGVTFAKRWRIAAEYLELYSKVVTVIVAALLIAFIWRYLRKRRNAQSTSNAASND